MVACKKKCGFYLPNSQDADLNIVLVSPLIANSEKLTQNPGVQTRIFTRSGHCVRLARSSLAISEYANIVAFQLPKLVFDAQNSEASTLSLLDVGSLSGGHYLQIKWAASGFPVLKTKKASEMSRGTV